MVGRRVQLQHSPPIKFFGCSRTKAPGFFREPSWVYCTSGSQVHLSNALIGTVTGCEQREAALLGSPPICSLRNLSVHDSSPDNPSVEVGHVPASVCLPQVAPTPV